MMPHSQNPSQAPLLHPMQQAHPSFHQNSTAAAGNAATPFVWSPSAAHQPQVYLPTSGPQGHQQQPSLFQHPSHAFYGHASSLLAASPTSATNDASMTTSSQGSVYTTMPAHNASPLQVHHPYVTFQGAPLYPSAAASPPPSLAESTSPLPSSQASVASPPKYWSHATAELGTTTSVMHPYLVLAPHGSAPGSTGGYATVGTYQPNPPSTATTPHGPPPSFANVMIASSAGASQAQSVSSSHTGSAATQQPMFMSTTSAPFIVSQYQQLPSPTSSSTSVVLVPPSSHTALNAPPTLVQRSSPHPQPQSPTRECAVPPPPQPTTAAQRFAEAIFRKLASSKPSHGK